MLYRFGMSVAASPRRQRAYGQMMLQSPAVAVEADVKRYPELAQKRVLIAGAERSFGFAIAKGYARNGARLVVQAARLDGANRIAGNGLRVFACKPRSQVEIERLADAAATAYSGLDVAVAVTSLPKGWLEMLAADLEAPGAAAMALPFLVHRRVAERMKLKNIRGALVTVATLPASGPEGSAGRTMIAGALSALVRRQAEDYAPYGIRSFGIAAEPLVAPLPGNAEDEPGIARTGRCRSVAEAVLSLTAGGNQFLSGQTLTL